MLSPLLVRPPISPCVTVRHRTWIWMGKLHRWQVIDLANPKTDLCWQIPQEICKEAMHFAGSSYGQLICGLRKDCLIVDVFTGAGQSLLCNLLLPCVNARHGAGVEKGSLLLHCSHCRGRRRKALLPHCSHSRGRRQSQPYCHI